MTQQSSRFQVGSCLPDRWGLALLDERGRPGHPRDGDPVVDDGRVAVHRVVVLGALGDAARPPRYAGQERVGHLRIYRMQFID